MLMVQSRKLTSRWSPEVEMRLSCRMRDCLERQLMMKKKLPNKMCAERKVYMESPDASTYKNLWLLLSARPCVSSWAESVSCECSTETYSSFLV